MIDKVMDTMANYMNKTAAWLTLPTLPWADFADKWQYFITLIAEWNQIFPLTDMMIIVGLIIYFAMALLVFYTVVLVKSFIPFLGGK